MGRLSAGHTRYTLLTPVKGLDTYVGRDEHTLVRRDGGLRIHHRRAILDLEALRPHGKVSIIL